jgi:hypothetical protein
MAFVSLSDFESLSAFRAMPLAAFFKMRLKLLFGHPPPVPALWALLNLACLFVRLKLASRHPTSAACAMTRQRFLTCLDMAVPVFPKHSSIAALAKPMFAVFLVIF